MKTILKTLLALGLAWGFLVLDAHAQASKPSIAFLGLTLESDPMVRDNLSSRIQSELAADSGLFSYPQSEISLLFGKNVIPDPQIGAMDLPQLAKAMGAQFYAYGKLEQPSWVGKRTWWKPWALKVTWTQKLHIRVLDASTAKVILDQDAVGEFMEKARLTGPAPWELIPPLLRNSYMQKFLPLISLESAKAVAKAVKEKAVPAGTASSP